MKTVERILLATLGFFALFALHQLVRLLFAAHKWPAPDASAWAAWVQAVGSVLAIWFSARQFGKQRLREMSDFRRARARDPRDRKREREEIRASYLLKALLQGVYVGRILDEYSGITPTAKKRPEILNLYAERLSQLLAILQSIPYHNIDDEDARTLTKISTTLSEVRGLFSLRGQLAAEAQPEPIDAANYLRYISNGMQTLYDSYETLTGKSPFGLGPNETPGGSFCSAKIPA